MLPVTVHNRLAGKSVKLSSVRKLIIATKWSVANGIVIISHNECLVQLSSTTLGAPPLADDSAPVEGSIP